MEQNNPEALEDNKEVVYQDQQATVTRAPLYGGTGEVVTGYRNEENDPESRVYAPVVENPPTAPNVVVTSTSARQTVRPSPTHGVGPSKTQATSTGQPRRTDRGFLGTFSTKSKGRFFFPLQAGIVLFSFLVLVSSALVESRRPLNTASPRFLQYTVAVSQVSFAVSLAACVMERLGLLENPHLRVALSAFLVFFWVPALVLITFFGVFASPIANANGFFGAWGALIVSAVAFSYETDQTYRDRRRNAAPRTSLLVIFLTSLMVMGSGIQVLSFQESLPGGGFGALGPRWSYTVYSIAFGAVAALYSLIMLLTVDAMAPMVMLVLGIILFLWIGIGTLLLTFADPFLRARGNGYYSSLFTLVASFGLLMSLEHSHRERDANSATGAPGSANTATGANVNRNTRRESRTTATYFMFLRAATFASLAVLIAGSLTCRNNDGCDNSMQRFQIAAGAIGLGLGLIFCLLEPFTIGAMIRLAFAILFLLWWVACFIVLTYFGTFISPAALGVFANGFFFTWIALVFAALVFAESLKELARNRDPFSPLIAKSGFLLLIIIGSLIELGAAIRWFYSTNNSQLSRYALALGSASTFLVIVLFFALLCARNNYETHDSLYNIGLYFLTIWWALGALVLTYKNLWNSAVDNGYFSVYFTLGTCLLALSGMWRTDDEDMDETTNRDTTASGRV